MTNTNTRETNKVRVSGILTEEFRYSHTVLSEDFYETILKVKRLSGNEDLIPIVISEILLEYLLEESVKGKYVEITGQYRTYNVWVEGGKSHLKQNLFVSSIEICDKDELETVGDADINSVYLKGFICKEPVFRVTPAGIKITDLIVAVNRGYGKSDYIPCIAWNKMALFTSKLNVGDKIALKGRAQSREYLKTNYDTGIKETKIAYEISIISVEKCDETEETEESEE